VSSSSKAQANRITSDPKLEPTPVCTRCTLEARHHRSIMGAACQPAQTITREAISAHESFFPSRQAGNQANILKLWKLCSKQERTRLNLSWWVGAHVLHGGPQSSLSPSVTGCCVRSANCAKGSPARAMMLARGDALQLFLPLLEKLISS
jgi:hypothetical protein